MPNKTAFVTGGTGFIGLNLIEHLVQSGWTVTALHRPESRLTQLQKYSVSLVKGTIEDFASLERAMPEELDAVFHVAGDTSMWPGHLQRQWRTNVDGTRNVVTAALAKRTKKFIHTSTSGVYGLPKEPFDETAPKLGKGGFNYQHSKVMAEEEVSAGIARGLDAVILNPANVIGRYDWNSWSQFIRRAANRQLPLIPPGSHCYCDVGAVVRAHVTAVEKGRTGHNYILGGTSASYAEIVQMVGKMLGRPTNMWVGRPLGMRLAGRMLDGASVITRSEPMITRESAAYLSANIRCRSDKAVRELDYRPVSIELMLKECIDWMLAEKLIDPVFVSH
ncbi:NAD-dependent epimerase/dehydratase family protein [Hyphomicrobium facile]|uniref:Dihydroflavonol-4-reductase n=1 Tax=Hyphomicrobium facile TaxID=51670 RepID=A0A1I7NHF5_9HYPH|nr:NAD-dependent epimerase/dehydratase family protein [Hyphomicrobium facile]SFV34095.1 dihydroflavonol-4-reductase [Hyphomicrobium facile]